MTNLTAFFKTLLNKENPTFKKIGLGTVLETAITELNAATTLTGKRVSIDIAAGTNAAAVDISAFSPAITSIVAIFAITTATGAAAAKLLLAETTDYTFANGVLTTVGDKSAVTLIVVYK
jgi:hypothetical protein